MFYIKVTTLKFASCNHRINILSDRVTKHIIILSGTSDEMESVGMGICTMYSLIALNINESGYKCSCLKIALDHLDYCVTKPDQSEN